MSAGPPLAKEADPSRTCRCTRIRTRRALRAEGPRARALPCSRRARARMEDAGYQVEERRPTAAHVRPRGPSRSDRPGRRSDRASPSKALTSDRSRCRIRAVRRRARPSPSLSRTPASRAGSRFLGGLGAGARHRFRSKRAAGRRTRHLPSRCSFGPALADPRSGRQAARRAESDPAILARRRRPAPASVPFEVLGRPIPALGRDGLGGPLPDPDLPASTDSRSRSTTRGGPRPGAVRSNWRRFEIERKGDVELVVPLTAPLACGRRASGSPGRARRPRRAGASRRTFDGGPVRRRGDRDGRPRRAPSRRHRRRETAKAIRASSVRADGEDGTSRGPAPLWGRVSRRPGSRVAAAGTGVQDGSTGRSPSKTTGRARHEDRALSSSTSRRARSASRTGRRLEGE